MSALEVRPFETADLFAVMPSDRIVDIPADWTAHGLTLTLAGEPVAVGGLVLAGGNWWTFAEITEPARRPMTVHRLVMDGLAAADRIGIDRLYGYCDMAYPRAQAWIERMGFRPARDDERDESIRSVETIVKHTAWIRRKNGGD